MSAIATGGEAPVHVHDPIVEGPLPEGFSPEGRAGKVRNVYLAPSGLEICLIASDRVSAFDQVSPTPIPGKGAILNDIARQELEAAEDFGIHTWLTGVPDDNPRAAVGVHAEVLPAELIFRNFMTGSMWREYEAEGEFAGFTLPGGLREWHEFEEPLFTPSTKSDVKDVNFHPSEVEAKTGIDPETFERMESVGRELFQLGTERAAERGLILVDTKYEMGLSASGELLVIDEVHTPDSSRFVLESGFDEAVADGRRPDSLSKEFLRGIMLDRAGGDVERAKQLMQDPLPQEVVNETAARYRQLHAIFTAVV